ncbi:MAG: hypothetical protein HYZ26_10880 [Chloroflexi bacterium]|nr:hypothetical protein [Chloroflexota bacterium]
MPRHKKLKITTREQATSSAYLFGMGAFVLAYFVAEAALAARPHPLHWVAALSAATIAAAAAYWITLRRSTG